MAMITGSLLGDKELRRALEGLPDNIRNKALRQALREEMKPVLDDAQQNAADTSQRLARTMRLRALKLRRSTGIGVKVETGTREELGIPADDRYYWPAAIELGTEFIRPRAYMRRALAKHKSNMLNRVARNMTQKVNTIVARDIERSLRNL